MAEKSVTQHGDIAADIDRSWRDEEWTGNRKLSVAAKEQAVTEEQMSPLQCVRNYPWAIFWCLAVSTTVIMEGYDTVRLLSEGTRFGTG